MPIRRSPNGARHVRPQPGRNRPERVVAVNRKAWSQSVGTGGRNHPVRAIKNLARRLEHDYPGVSGSILEGMDEILTVTRLGLLVELRRSLIGWRDCVILPQLSARLSLRQGQAPDLTDFLNQRDRD